MLSRTSSLVLMRTEMPATVALPFPEPLRPDPDSVVVDTNHRWAGQAMDLDVELIGIKAPDSGPGPREP